jgi:hypothetical protein
MKWYTAHRQAQQAYLEPDLDCRGYHEIGC